MEFHIPLMRNTWLTCGGESLTALTQVGITPLTFGFSSLYHPSHTIRSLCPSVASWSFWGCWTQGEILRFQQAATQCLSKYTLWLKTYVESKTRIILCLSSSQTIHRNLYTIQITSRSTGVKTPLKQPAMATFPAFVHCTAKTAQWQLYWNIKLLGLVFFLFKWTEYLSSFQDPSLFRSNSEMQLQYYPTWWLTQSTALTESHAPCSVQTTRSSLPPLKPSKSKTESWAKCCSETSASDRWLMTSHTTCIYWHLETKCWASCSLLLVLCLA